jgi:cobalt-precorrin 5A hydrolase / precorrin-3B C17-methyltransferase
MRSPDHGYPILLTQLSLTACVVVGGGRVGERKVSGLLAAAAGVRVISPQLTTQLHAWVDTGRIAWEARPYQPGDLAGVSLVFAATDRREVNAAVARDARALGLLCNVADAPEEGSFHVPAVYRGADELVAVSTYGQDPTRARTLRDRIAAWLKPEM